MGISWDTYRSNDDRDLFGEKSNDGAGRWHMNLQGSSTPTDFMENLVECFLGYPVANAYKTMDNHNFQWDNPISMACHHGGPGHLEGWLRCSEGKSLAGEDLNISQF